MSTLEIVQDSRNQLTAGSNPMIRAAGWISLFMGAVWILLLGRWVTFSSFEWTALKFELALSELPGIFAYLIYIGFGALDIFIGVGLLREVRKVEVIGLARSAAVVIGALVYYFLTKDFFGASWLLGISGYLILLIRRNSAWSINYGAAFWLIVFFVVPMLIVFVVSLGERSLRGTIVFPQFSFLRIGDYFDDYVRFFSKIQGEFLYLRIMSRSVWLATLNTIICLLIGYPFAYWIARQPVKYRNVLVFLVMIPFWTNFLVRTYAWMLILRDSGIINSFWTITLHDQAVLLANNSALFTWLAEVTANKLPLMFNQPAVFLGLFYGYLPFVVLPLYSNLEKLDWSLLEAAADLGANKWQSTIKILLPLSLPGIVAAAIIVFIPSLGAYVTPDLMGGGKVSMLGNLLQQQFMTARDWPFGSAIGFIMMALMLLAILFYFRVGGRENA